MTKAEIWKSMDDKTKDFIKALTKQGLTIRTIKTKRGVWKK